MLTYGDLMTLLMTFFVLLFSMSTIQIVKFQAQIGVIQGALGISERFKHTPVQKQLPAPAVKQTTRVTIRVKEIPTEPRPQSDSSASNNQMNRRSQEQSKVKSIMALGIRGDLNIRNFPDEIILVLPSYGIFDKGDYEVNSSSPEVQKAIPLYSSLAKQITSLTNYEIHFVGHTDALPIRSKSKKEGAPKDNIELGFRRAIAMYQYFFESKIPDRSRVTFSSQGDNVPIVPNAELDSERRKNRRVEIHLKRMPPEAS